MYPENNYFYKFFVLCSLDFDFSFSNTSIYVFGFHVLNEFSATFNTFKAIQPNALFLRVEFIPLIDPYLFTNYNLGLSSTPLFGFIHVLIIVEGY